jgi:hypothetical protein
MKQDKFKSHQEWLKGWYYGMLLGELTEAKNAGCDWCVREIKKAIKSIENKK